MKNVLVVCVIAAAMASAPAQAKILTISSQGTVTSLSAKLPFDRGDGIYPVSGPQIGESIEFSVTFDTAAPQPTGGVYNPRQPTAVVRVGGVSYSFLNPIGISANPSVMYFNNGQTTYLGQLGASSLLLNGADLQTTPLGMAYNPVFGLFATDPSRTILTSNDLNELPIGVPNFTSQSFSFSAFSGGYNLGFVSNNMLTAISVAGGVPEPATWAMFIGGFGLIGSAMRSHRRVGVHFSRVSKT